MDRGRWRATVHGVAKSQTQLSNEHFYFGRREVSKSRASPNRLIGEPDEASCIF